MLNWRELVRAAGMEYKEAIEVLKSLVEKRPLADKEKEAVMTAMVLQLKDGSPCPKAE